jgi:hypothetical protein
LTNCNKKETKIETFCKIAHSFFYFIFFIKKKKKLSHFPSKPTSNIPLKLHINTYPYQEIKKNTWISLIERETDCRERDRRWVVLLVRGGQQQAVLGRWGRETVVMEDEGWEILKFWGRRVFRNEGNMRFFLKKNK